MLKWLELHFFFFSDKITCDPQPARTLIISILMRQSSGFL
jgi:hypothetical protein